MILLSPVLLALAFIGVVSGVISFLSITAFGKLGGDKLS